MKLRLTLLPADKVIGGYGKNLPICDRDEKSPNYRKWDLLVPGGMPEKARALSPEAAIDWLRFLEDLGHPLVVTDMLRDPKTSLRISSDPKRSALPPGWSGHQYGFSFDAINEAIMHLLGLKKMKDLRALMAKYNFFNFWNDGKESHPKEDWHWNHFLPEFRDANGGFASKTTVAYLENMIQKKYGVHMILTPLQGQLCLQKLGYYRGDLDGKIGKMSIAAILDFQNAWRLPKSGEFDKKTMRLLAYLTAEIEWVNVANSNIPQEKKA